jgi:hypothetical protein
VAAGGIDLAASMHWPAPIVTRDVDQDRGPVLVTIEYRIEPATRDAFLTALEGLAPERRRDGAYDWVLQEKVHLFHLGDGPKVTHFIAAESVRLRRQVRG